MRRTTSSARSHCLALPRAAAVETGGAMSTKYGCARQQHGRAGSGTGQAQQVSQMLPFNARTFLRRSCYLPCSVPDATFCCAPVMSAV